MTRAEIKEWLPSHWGLTSREIMTETQKSWRTIYGIAKELGLPRHLVNHDGKVYGKLTILGRTDVVKRVRVRCECGVVFETSLNNIVMGRTQSCGCIKSERFRYWRNLKKKNNETID